MVSTAPQTYSSAPDDDTLNELRQRCMQFSAKEDVEDEGLLYVELASWGWGDTVRVSRG
jgi:hypothetical protein